MNGAGGYGSIPAREAEFLIFATYKLGRYICPKDQRDRVQIGKILKMVLKWKRTKIELFWETERYASIDLPP